MPNTVPSPSVVSSVLLSEHLKSHSQQSLATAVGCHQTYISRMHREGRPIKVVTYSDGVVELREERVIAKSN